MLTCITEATLGDNNYYRGRWVYLQEVIAFIERYCRDLQPSDVLELGCYLYPLVNGSDTMELRPEVNPTYCHNANEHPWPFADSQYGLFIACQVLEHLGSPDGGMQQRAFHEIRRVCCGAVIISVPYRWPATQGWHAGIDLNTVIDWASKDPDEYRICGTAPFERVVCFWQAL